MKRLDLNPCPHCGIAKPLLTPAFNTRNQKGVWSLYTCTSCEGMVLTQASTAGDILKVWPPAFSVSESVPQRAREFLTQAAASLHTPAGAVMLTASAVDAMLKHKGYKEGVLNSRIKAAAADHLITSEMAEWAHEVRLDANDQRHADESASLPNQVEAGRSLEFAQALAQFMYVLPARVAEGRKEKLP